MRRDRSNSSHHTKSTKRDRSNSQGDEEGQVEFESHLFTPGRIRVTPFDAFFHTHWSNIRSARFAFLARDGQRGVRRIPSIRVREQKNGTTRRPSLPRRTPKVPRKSRVAFRGQSTAAQFRCRALKQQRRGSRRRRRPALVRGYHRSKLQTGVTSSNSSHCILQFITPTMQVAGL